MNDMDLTNYEEVVELVTKIVKEKLNNSSLKTQGDFNIPIGVSNKHIHVCREDLDLLYGKGYELTKLRDISQPGQYAAKETVTLVGPKMRAIEGVRILGPIRDFTQAELAQTDGIKLGLKLPIRVSGDIQGAAPLTVIGPKGSIYLKEGAIRHQRHLHMTEKDAVDYQVKDRDIVGVEVSGEAGVIFQNVVVRISNKFQLELHLDTDEGNAAGVCVSVFCRLIK